MIRGGAGLLGGAVLSVALVACAMSPQMRSSAPRASSADAGAGLPMGRGGPEHDEIESLWTSIAADRQQHGMAEGFEGYAVTPIDRLAVCTPPHSDRCTDTCTVADAICDNAKKICDLATRLPGDAWANGKCDDGTKSCDQAHKLCCDCQ